MTAVIVALVVFGILQLASFAELCILAHRMDEMKKQPKYNVHVSTRGAYSGEPTEAAIREAMLRRPS